MILDILCFLAFNPITLAIVIIFALKQICDEEEKDAMEHIEFRR